MRIIAGKARGAQLFSPKGLDTRPTLDRIKESLFNIIASDIPDAQVLDLFAGSGALGLESISRGADSAIMVDMDKLAQSCIKRNIEKLHFEMQASLLPCSYGQALDRLEKEGKAFHLVFLDPPYRMEVLADIAQLLHEKRLLHQEALLVLEHSHHYTPCLSDNFALESVRNYKETIIHLYRYGGKS